MADGPYRHYGAGTGQQQQFYYQQQQQQRQIARNGSPVNHNSRPAYNETPSPSRSPVSQSSGHPFAMSYNTQAQSMINGGGAAHQRFMMGVNQHAKYGHHQQHQQQGHHHHAQQNQHHHQQNHAIHAGHGGIGHQHSYSGSTAFTPVPSYNSALPNGGLNDESPDIDESLPEHWQHQIQAWHESRQGVGQFHRHSRKNAASLVSRPTKQAHNDESVNDDPVERNRAVAAQEKPRQDWTGIDLSGQGLRALSSHLFMNYDFLTKLFIDGNRLTRLPVEIGQLRKLKILDASSNQIQEIPATIGMLSELQELKLFDNQIRTVPSELGYLFNLTNFGIEGNPIDEDTKDYLIQHGIQALVAQLRDTSEPGPPPRDRPLHVIDDSDAQEIVTILSHNILCDRYATRAQYGHTPARALQWEYRRHLVFEEIKELDADIVCLQELDQENFSEFFSNQLAILGFKGLFHQKTRARTMSEDKAKLVDGCAIFYRASKYILLDKQMVTFTNTAINRPDMKGEHDIFNRVMPKDNVALCAFFENRMTGSRLIVSNAHLHWAVEEEDVKVVQTAILLEHLTEYAERWAKMPPKENKSLAGILDPSLNLKVDGEAISEPQPSQKYASGTQIPMILCGDLNSTKTSAVYELITRGSLAKQAPVFEGRSYGKLTKEGITHPFNLKDAHAGENGGKDYLTLTNYVWHFKDVIEYLFHTPNIRRRKLLGDIDFDYVHTHPGFPDYHFPSDHLTLYAEFSVEAPKRTTKVEATFPTSDRKR